MEPTRHTIIRLPEMLDGPRRKKGPTTRSGRDPGFSFEGPPASAESDSMKIEAADMTPAQAQDMRRDDGVLVVPAMPLGVLEPPPDGSTKALEDPEDAEVTWGVEAVGALESEYDGRKITVAILDTGIDLDHDAFGRLLDEERVITKNFLSGSPKDDVSDTDGHGTHVAGTICGDEVDGVRIGVAPGIGRLLVGKVLGPGSDTDKILNALLWTMEKGADIVSMSLGVDFPSRVESLVEDHGLPIQQATSMALENYRHTLDAFAKITQLLAFRQVLVVAATGNESARPDYTINESPPAAATNILSVAALERRDQGLHVAAFSNTGPELAAPGVAVRSAKLGGGLGTRNGTSMAAPHVAGVAALWCQHLRKTWGSQLPTATLRAKLVGSATMDPIESGSRTPVDIGSGLVRAPVD